MPKYFGTENIKKNMQLLFIIKMKMTAECFELKKHVFSVKFSILKRKNGHFIFVLFLKVTQEVF